MQMEGRRTKRSLLPAQPQPHSAANVAPHPSRFASHPTMPCPLPDKAISSRPISQSSLRSELKLHPMLWRLIEIQVLPILNLRSFDRKLVHKSDENGWEKNPKASNSGGSRLNSVAKR